MKNICFSVLFFAAALLTVGCAREDALETRAKGDVVIRVSLDGLTTKATLDGNEVENAVNSLDVIIFNSEGTQQLHKWHQDSPTLSGDYYEQSVLVRDMPDVGSDPDAVLRQARTLAIANYPGAISDFNGKTLAQVQAMAVEASNTANAAAGGKFIYELEDGTYQTLDEPSFAMTSELGSFTRTDGENELVSTVTLKRLAAKLTLTLDYPTTDIITYGEYGGHETQTIWEPMIGENTRIYLDNGAKNASLGGPVSNPDVFRYADIHPSVEVPFVTPPFYTYPIEWTAGSDRAPFIKIIQPWHYVTAYNGGTEENPKPVIVDENVVELYYKVMFPGLTSLESNTWYQPAVTLNVLGGEAEEPVTLDLDGLGILNWGTATNISAVDIRPTKYLVPETNAITVENGHTVNIKFIASSNPTLTVNSIHKDVFANEGMVRKYMYDPSLSGSGSNGHHGTAGILDYYVPIGESGEWLSKTFDVSSNSGEIILNHTLSAAFAESNFSARPYTYELTLSLGDAEVPDQTVTITQYPPLYADGQESTGWVCVNGNSTDARGLYRARTTSSENPITIKYPINAPGYIYSRMIYSSATQTQNLGAVAGYAFLDVNDVNSNSCKWRIIVRPTVAEGRYLQDPRISFINDQGTAVNPANTTDYYLYEILNQTARGQNNNNTYNYSPLVGNNNGTENQAANAYIQKYRPAKRKATITGNNPDPLPGTAPEYMVASSYGKTTAVNYTSAVNRCAAYQEDGFPAGRWRLPTEDEIFLAIQLNNEGTIPNLFGGTYWASTGRYYDSTTGRWTAATNSQLAGNTDAIYARCVYDTWYWGQEEVTALRTSNYGTNYSQPQYDWSGYQYSYKH